MEAAFNKMKQEGSVNVDNLMAWLKTSKLVDESKASEEKVMKLLESAKEGETIEYAKFKDVVAKLGADQQKSEAEYSRMMTDALSNLQQTLGSVATALHSAMSSK